MTVMLMAVMVQAAGPVIDLQSIEEAYLAGQISIDQKAILQVQAIRHPELVPDRYRFSSLAQANNRATNDATSVLKSIRDNWDLLSPATQEVIQNALGRAATAFTYDSPGGFFKLHYDTAQDSSGWVPADDGDSSGVPDFIEKCAAYADTVLEVHRNWGYQDPPSDGSLGGDSKYDFYFLETSYYGVTTPEGSGPAPWNDYVTYITLNSDFLGFDPNDDPEGDQWGAMKATIAHEFHHAVQFSYDGTEPMWFMDLDATYFEDIVFDATNDNYNYLNMFFDDPEISLQNGSDHRYSTFIYGLFIAQKFDTSLMRSAWEGSVFGDGVFETLGDSLEAHTGWTQDSAFGEFAMWNYVTNVRNNGLYHEEAANYPLISVGEVHSTYPVPLQNSPGYPEGYGATYVEFIPPAAPKTFQFTFNGSDSRHWAAWLIKSTGPNEHTCERLELSPSSYVATGEIQNFEEYYSVALIGVNLDEGSPGTPFSYQAAVYDPYAVVTSINPYDSVLFAGKTRAFPFLVENASELTDNFTISTSDSKGWGTSQTVNRQIAPLSDTTFMVNVTPPDGTPVGDTCYVHFIAESWSAPTVADTQTVLFHTIVQRGDMNLDGTIDISDLVFLVTYMFADGPEPTPLSASDFNCSGGNDISDLVNMVQFMFQDGDPSPCNPY